MPGAHEGCRPEGVFNSTINVQYNYALGRPRTQTLPNLAEMCAVSIHACSAYASIARFCNAYTWNVPVFQIR